MASELAAPAENLLGAGTSPVSAANAVVAEHPRERALLVYVSWPSSSNLRSGVGVRWRSTAPGRPGQVVQR
jgi:hypothetical protein